MDKKPLITRNIRMFKDVLDEEVMSILEKNRFIVFIAPVDTFYQFKDFKMNNLDEVSIPREDYFKLMEATVAVGDRLEELKARANAEELMQQVPVFDGVSVPTGGKDGETSIIKIPNEPIDAKELKERWKDNWVNMIVREDDYLSFTAQHGGSDCVNVKKEQYITLLANQDKAEALGNLLGGDSIAN